MRVPNFLITPTIEAVQITQIAQDEETGTVLHVSLIAQNVSLVQIEQTLQNITSSVLQVAEQLRTNRVSDRRNDGWSPRRKRIFKNLVDG